MIPELGHFALVLALVLALVQAVVPMIGASRNRLALMAVGRPAAQGQFFFILFSYACLTWAFIQSDFSVQLAAANSHSATPLMYKITGVWGNHEGSLLLWAMSLSLWTVAVTVFSRHLPEAFVARVLGVLGWVSVGFLSFLLVTSNPFDRLLPAVGEGRDLNPLLQDPGMIIHPPLLYMGYVGFSVAFAFAIAALLSGRLDAAWARWSRPWTTVAWVFLTAGIAIGSGWAYYELGWGGWWFWDPVENASFMPWLLGTALMHSLAVTEKRGAFRSWTVLLAISAFSLSLLGTFIVRSGVITSVHAFATDPKRGLFILALLVIVIGVSLLLYAWRAPKLGGGGSFGLVSRETSLLGNNVLLSVASASVLLGTMYPLFLDALGMGKISVGPPYFEAVFIPLMTPVVVLMMFGPFLRWKDDDLGAAVRKVAPAFIASVLIGVGTAYAVGHVTWRTVLGLALAAWVVLASIQLLAGRITERAGAAMGARLRSITAAWWGMWLAHLGIGVFIIGVTLVGSLDANLDVKMQNGQHAELAGYTFTFRGVQDADGPNYDAARATIDVTRDGRPVATLTPEKRLYVAQGMPMTEASIDIGPFRDVYVSLGEQIEDGSWIVSLYYKPFISWIWLGCILMGLGGICAAADRRYRRLAARDATVAANQRVA
ncbi:heme lyase CcmF/NrfE family subunit [Thauera linaloolentis]|uniref:Cytochrome c-type biogenesis protein n=1 Tax=Thauera linaloolentis (strain DSM 12138 / JCM 21573 / CCUG 41526 / CIP 105981 / IAM 15112 / NBRC 102519 / 47Lol) TaxID=1123367 RepID=N6Y6D7_THAL4|nr:heme lyase CcmF/NrfE family subunit [Thauera linaloolentis]ENO87150.1 cytochrome c-type biogenesis protein [Thauera linaloolentis 47Lol = DSM 12138]MCM8566417.1 heme lyase CcmF/NrfE family subunit [Thauera linaloolentis]